MSTYMYVRMLGCMHKCMYVVCLCTSVYGCEMRVAAFRTYFLRSGLITGDLELCPLWTRFNGDLKTDPWDDLEIRTGSCREDQRRFGSKTVSFHVSLFVALLFIYLCQRVYCLFVYAIILSFHVLVLFHVNTVHVVDSYSIKYLNMLISSI